jgi:HK97 family phage major capsid protein
MNKKEFDAKKVEIAEKIGNLKKRADLSEDAKSSFGTIEAAFNDTLQSIESLFEKEGNVSEIETKLNDVSTKLETIEKAKHGDAITAINAALVELKGKIQVVPEEDAGWKGFYTENADAIKAIKTSRQSLPFDNMKAASLITTGNVLPTPNPYLPSTTVLPGIVPVTRPSQRIIDFISRGIINTPNIALINEVNGEGDAAFVAEGAVKPLMDFDFRTEDAKAKKIAVSVKISEEMLADIDFMAAETERLISDKLQRFLGTKILTGTGLLDEIKGVAAYAGGYAQTCLNGKITAPGLPEVLRAAAAQIRSLGFDGKLTAFVNPCDYTENVLRKDANGQLLDLSGTLEGIEVVATGEIAPDNFLIGDLSKYKFYVYKDYTIRYGYDSGDFRSNIVTIIAEMRVVAIMSQNEIGALVKDSISAVVAEIETA